MIYKATKNDIQEVLNLYDKVFDYIDSTNINLASWYRGIYPNIDTVKDATKQGTLYILKENEEIVGSVILDTDKHKDYDKLKWNCSYPLLIHTLCINPKYFGQNKSRLLFDFAKSLAKENGHDSLALFVYKQNAPAMHLYKKYGFECVGSCYFTYVLPNITVREMTYGFEYKL